MAGTIGTMHRIEFLDLGRSAKALKPAISEAIAGVLDSGRFLLGERLEQFEEAFARYCGAAQAVGVASGTDALRLALLACGVGEGHEVITVSNTCVPTVSAISSLGATPVFADIDPETFTIAPPLIESRITERTRAILPVHLYGQCAEMDSVLEVARRYGLRVIEDCAQAHGARFQGRAAGTTGDAGCYSFYPTKNLGAIGDAGMVITNDRELAERVRLLRDYGRTDRYRHAMKGYNSRLDEVQASVLLVKLPHLDAWNERRRAIARTYADGLARVPLICPSEASGRHHVYHLYVVRVRNRSRFQVKLAERGVATLIHYPIPVHRQPAYAELASSEAHLALTGKLADEILSLPLYPELADDEVDGVIDAIRDSLEA